MAPDASIVRHKVAPGTFLRAPLPSYVEVSMFMNHGGIEQVKLWCEVRSICVVFAVKYISSCVGALTFENLITRSYYHCNGSFSDMLNSTHGIGGTRNTVVYACPTNNRLVCENGVTVIRIRTTKVVI